jgi:hypothetical protein
MKPKIPTAEDLRKALVVAKDKAMNPVRKAGDELIKDFSNHLVQLIANPSKFTGHTCYIKEMPAGAWHKGNYDFFLEYVRTQLPEGYRVEQSHDGGGMYSTIVIRWDIVKVKPARPMSHRQEHGSGN